MATRKPTTTKPPARGRAAAGPKIRREKTLASADIPLLEWIAAGVGLVLTLVVIGVIAWEAINADKTPPAMGVTLQAVSPVAGGYVAQIELTNQGGEPAAQVVVEGRLVAPGAEPEISDVTFDYVPDHSTRNGGLFFKGDPRKGELALRAKGFVEP